MNFTLREPPEKCGKIEDDFYELCAWCRELYDNLWLSDFISNRKTEGTQNEGEDI